jgi:hypothetical protein
MIPDRGPVRPRNGRRVIADSAHPSLLMGERRKRSTQAETLKWTDLVASLPIVIAGETNARARGDTLSLARGHDLSDHDAADREPTIRRGLPLATIDEKLKTPAQAVGVALLEVS